MLAHEVGKGPLTDAFNVNDSRHLIPRLFLWIPGGDLSVWSSLDLRLVDFFGLSDYFRFLGLDIGADILPYRLNALLIVEETGLKAAQIVGPGHRSHNVGG